MRLLVLSLGTLLLLGITQCTSIRHVEDIELVTTDIDNFWVAYPAAMRDTAQAYRVFQEQYFAKASPGLQHYYKLRYQENPRLFARRITQRPLFYASAHQTMLAVAEQKPQILAAFRQLQKLYPPVHFNHIYFLVGGFAGSTAQPPGLLINTDYIVDGPGVDTSELSLVQRNRCGRLVNLPALVTHEMVHNVQQLNDGTLLSSAIREGMADFVAKLVTGTPGPNTRLHPYGNTHERELWAAFSKEMSGSYTKNWLANLSCGL